MTETPIILLGPKGATFTYRVYGQIAPLFGAPALNGNIVEVKRNREVLQMLAHTANAFGLVAVETKAKGQVSESLDSFVMLDNRKSGEHRPRIIGAVRMPIWFALMSNNVGLDDIVGVLGHEQATEACAAKIEEHGWVAENSSSNGQAAADVAKLPRYKCFAALGPEEAAKKYGLRVLNPHFQKGITTFFLLSTSPGEIVTREQNRALVVFRTRGDKGALRETLEPFDRFGINMRYLHSVHVDDGVNEFIAEIEVSDSQLKDVSDSVQAMKMIAKRCVIFGPFPLIDM